MKDLAKRFRLAHRQTGAIAAIVVFALMMISTVQASRWQNTVALWEHTLRVTKNNVHAHNNLETALSRRGPSRGRKHTSKKRFGSIRAMTCAKQPPPMPFADV